MRSCGGTSRSIGISMRNTTAMTSLQLNFWTPLASCGYGTPRPGLQAVISSLSDLVAYTEYRETGHAGATYAPGQHFHKFIDARFTPDALAAHFPRESFAAPHFEVGDVLVLTNFTLHGTYCATGMTEPRASLEIRLDGKKRPF